MMLSCIYLAVSVLFAAGTSGVRRFEGDILLDHVTSEVIHHHHHQSSHFDARLDRTWPKAVIPYAFDSRIDSTRRQLVKEAVAEFTKYTCLRFIPRTNQRDYVRFWFGPDCSSYVGRRMYSQDLSLGKRCAQKGIIMHELMHAIGFFHEQSRLDRNNYIRIAWENIMGGWKENFQKYSHGEADYLGEPYDYASLMHYPANAFSRNGKNTIIPLKPTNGDMGQRAGFSIIDIRQINKLYNCNNILPTAPIMTAAFSTTRIPSTTAFTSIPGCIDTTARCSLWAKMGECQRNPDYMLKNCKPSCNACGNPCLDFKIRCRFWVHNGECATNASKMRKYCRRSCKLCN